MTKSAFDRIAAGVADIRAGNYTVVRKVDHPVPPQTSDEWDEKARELCLILIRRDEPKAGSPGVIAASLRSAYENGVEDSAEVAFAYTDDMKGAEIIRDAIRALKGEGR